MSRPLPGNAAAPRRDYGNGPNSDSEIDTEVNRVHGIMKIVTSHKCMPRFHSIADLGGYTVDVSGPFWYYMAQTE